MIQPIGHEESGVRRLPWISYAVMALCFLTFLLVRPSASPEAGEEDWTELDPQLAQGTARLSLRDPGLEPDDRTHAEAILAEVSGAAAPRGA